MAEQRAKRSFSVTVLFSSFFGVAMIAIAFAYFNFKFSQYKFIDFSEWILYEKSELFKPTEPAYILLFYNSKSKMPRELLNGQQKYPVLAIDFAQKRFTKEEDLIYLTAPTNQLLKIIHRFNIYELPAVFIIKRSKESLYKQDSKIQILQ